jgi:hypothetical protein
LGYWIYLTTIAGKRADPVAKNLSNVFPNSSSLIGFGLRLTPFKINVFLRALENMVEHHRKMMNHPVLLNYKMPIYQQLNCQRTIPTPLGDRRRQASLNCSQ